MIAPQASHNTGRHKSHNVPSPSENRPTLGDRLYKVLYSVSG